MEALIVVIVLLVIAGVIALGRSMKVVQQYEKGVLYRFGRVESQLLEPGLVFIRPIGDRVEKVNMQIIAMTVPAQEGITRDNVSVRVDAVVYFRVVDPIKATVNVNNYMNAVSQQAQTSLRSIIGQSEMDQLLDERETVNKKLRQTIDEPTEEPWGIRVERVEIKDVSLPEGMKRSMSRQAEAASVMAKDPAALQLRLLQTVVEVAGEKNSTLVMPVPVELLRFFEKMAPGPAAPTGSTALADAEAQDLGDAEVAAAEAAIAHTAVSPTAEVPAIGDVPPVPEVPAVP